MARAYRLVFVALLLTAVSRGAAEQPILPSAFLLDGRQVDGRLSQVGPGWNIRLKSPQHASRQLAADELVSWGLFQEGRKGPLILLTDGSRIAADVIRLGADELVIESAHWSEASIPLEFVRGIVFRLPTDTKNRDALLNRVTGAPPGQDQLLLIQDRLVAGTIVASQRTNARFEQISIRPKSRPTAVNIDLGKIVAVVFNPAVSSLPKRRGLSALVGFRDGSQLNLQQLDRKDNELVARLDGGVKLHFAPLGSRDIWRWVVSIRPWQRRLVYLSDLKPLAYRHRPFLTLAWDYRRDRNVLNRRLRHDGKLFAKGLGMHSRSRIAYELNGRYKRFDAELAIDDAAQHMGSVVFRVYLQPIKADNSPGDWAMKYESPVVRGSGKRIPVSLDVANVFRMALIVDYADRGDERDYANWLNARLVRK